MAGGPGDASKVKHSGPQPVISLDRLFRLGDHTIPRGTAMDLGGWLRRLGLEKYEATFRENEIDDTVLPNLTAEDLKDLGVIIVGHRRKLLDAIAALRGAPIAKPPLSETSSSIVDRSHQDTAERRQVTVMFSDLVGSTALSARTDLRTCARSFQRIRKRDLALFVQRDPQRDALSRRRPLYRRLI